MDATADNQLSPSYKLRLVPHLTANFGIHVNTHDSIHEMTRDRLAMIARVSDFLYGITYRKMVRAYQIQAFCFKKTEEMPAKKHPDTLDRINNLASMLSNQGKHQEVEKMYRQALALGETVLGKEQPKTLTSRNTLAAVLGSQGKHEEVKKIHRQTLALSKMVLGKGHSVTLMNTILSAVREVKDCILINTLEPISERQLANPKRTLPFPPRSQSLKSRFPFALANLIVRFSNISMAITDLVKLEAIEELHLYIHHLDYRKKTNIIYKFCASLG